MNIFTGTGNLATDVFLTKVGEKSKASFKVAFSKPGKNGGADFIWVTTWERQAEVCAEYLTKGRSVGIIGSMTGKSVKQKDGTWKEFVGVTARSVEFGSQPKGPAATDTPPEEGEAQPSPDLEIPPDDGIPF